MPFRQLVISLFTLLALFGAAFSQTETTENFVIKPGQKVYILAVKGECGSGIILATIFATANGMVGVGKESGMRVTRGVSQERPEYNERQTLERYESLPAVAGMMRKIFTQNKTFFVVDVPEKADFIIRVCAAYTEDLMDPRIIQQMRIPSKLEFAEARLFPTATFLATQGGLNDPMWKAKTPDSRRPLAMTTEGKKKKKEKPPAQPQGTATINGVLVNTVQAPITPPEIDDLVNYFLQDYAKLAAIKIPKGQTEATIIGDPDRPALTNKPEDTPLEKPRPALVNKAGESLSTANSATTAKPNSEADEVIKIDTALIYVPVRVLDKDGKYIPDLAKKDFKVFEDSSEQEIENFSNVDDPFHVVLLLDMSGSTRFKVEEIQDAALEFIEQLRPQDRVMVASFESSIFVDADFTNDRAKLTKAILRTHTGGGTRLYDAVDLVMTERLNRIPGRKAVVLFSDGIDSASKIANVQSNLSKIEESNALFYPIHYNTLPDASNIGGMINGKPIPMSPQQIEMAKATLKEISDRSTMYMGELAIRSGGRFYEAENMTDAKSAFAKIAEELRRQYWLSYYSSNPKDDGSYRKIRVAVTQPANAPTWAVRAKNGYRAPKK
jgi:Ca-activated chloride channel homolog